MSTEEDDGNESRLLPLGEPEYEDVNAAARLLIRYGKESPLSAAGMRSFLMMVKDQKAVLARAQQLEEQDDR